MCFIIFIGKMPYLVKVCHNEITLGFKCPDLDSAFDHAIKEFMLVAEMEQSSASKILEPVKKITENAFMEGQPSMRVWEVGDDKELSYCDILIVDTE